MKHDLFLRIYDASSDLEYSDMWVSDVPGYLEGLQIIKSPPANILRLMKEQGSVFKLTDGENKPVAFSAVGKNQKKIRWITNESMCARYEDFGYYSISGNAYELGFPGKQKIDVFTKKFIENWRDSTDAKTMMQIIGFSGMKFFDDLVLCVCDMVDIAIDSRRDNKAASKEYSKAVQLVRDSVLTNISQHAAASYVNELYLYSGQWRELKLCLLLAYAKPESAPDHCFMFSVHTDETMEGNYHITRQQLANIVRGRVTAMQCLDKHIKPIVGGE